MAPFPGERATVTRTAASLHGWSIGNTASFAQGRSQSADWYVTDLSSFYYDHIGTMYNAIVW